MILKASKRLRKFFNGELTDEMIWREIIEEEKLDHIHQLTGLNAEATRALIRYEKRMHLLSLGITELSPEVAVELAKYDGEKLFLNCVRTLSPESAKAIAGFKGIKLTLNGLKTITLPVLGRLSNYKGILHLDIVKDIEISEKDSQRGETVFNNLGFARLAMMGLKRPSVPLLRALSRFPGQLELGGIETLSRGEAEVFCEHEGERLSLKGIKILSRELAALLEQYKGFLDLGGAGEIADEAVSSAASRPEGYSLFSAAVKKRVDSYKKEKTAEAQQLRKKRKEYEKKKKAQELAEAAFLEEFEEFTELEEGEPDPFESEIGDEVLEDIEINLNLKMSRKRRRLDELLAKGQSKLSDREKQEIEALEEEIRQLNEKIRGTLDILVERKELGSVVFTRSIDLAVYLKESGAEDNDNDALANIEEADMFGSIFDKKYPGSESGSDDKDMEAAKKEPRVIEGDDFVIKEV